MPIKQSNAEESNSSYNRVDEENKKEKITLFNLGFSETFLEEIKNPIICKKVSAFRKISSESAVEKISPSFVNLHPNKAKEYEDAELYQEDETENIFLNQNVRPNIIIQKETNCYDDEQSKNDEEVNESFNRTNPTFEKQVIKAYKSKHKSKFYRIYEINSVKSLETNKYKIFHKCNFGNCGRTFSSSGWLKAHFDEHLKEMEKFSFNILFEKFIKNLGNYSK